MMITIFISVLVKCHPSPISLPVFPLNIIYTFYSFCYHLQGTYYTNSLTFLVSNIIYIFHGLYHSKTFTPHQILLGHQIKEAEIGETCDSYEKKEKCILVAGGKPETKKKL